jgi:hypothetical protein
MTMEERLMALERKVDDLLSRLGSTDREKPGVEMRLDRSEQAERNILLLMKWISSGSLAGAALLLFMVYRIVRLFDQAGGS